LNFLIKTCLFLPFKNTFKKFWIFFFFTQHRYFLIFLYYFDMITGSRSPRLLNLARSLDLKHLKLRFILFLYLK
jgi:hypothetical protein